MDGKQRRLGGKDGLERLIYRVENENVSLLQWKNKSSHKDDECMQVLYKVCVFVLFLLCLSAFVTSKAGNGIIQESCANSMR